MIHHHPYIGLRMRSPEGTEGILVCLAVEDLNDLPFVHAYLLTDDNTHYSRALDDLTPCDPTEARRRLGVVGAPKVEPAPEQVSSPFCPAYTPKVTR